MVLLFHLRFKDKYGSKLDEHIIICKPVVIMCTGGKKTTKSKVFFNKSKS